MNYYFVNSNFDQGGVTSYTKTLSSILGKKNSKIISSKKNKDVDIIFNCLKGPKNIFSDLLDFIKFLNKNKNSIFIFQNSFSIILGRIISIFISINAIFIVHGWYWRGENFLVKYISVIVENFLSLFSFKYVFVADIAKEDILNIILFKNKIHNNSKVIYNSTPDNFDFDIEHYLNESKPVILVPMRKDRSKDHLNCFLLTFKSNYEFYFAGENVDEEYFKELTSRKHKKNVHFLGNVDDMIKIYLKSDLILLLSHFETLPLVLIEAMSMAKPIIASNVGDNKVLIKDYWNGFLVENNNDHSTIINYFNIILNKENYSNFSKNSLNLYKVKFSFKLFSKKIKNFILKS